MKPADVCHLPGQWSMPTAAPAYSAFAGILGGFVSLGMITLMSVSRETLSSSDTSGASRRRALMLFLPAFMSLLIASFLFGENSGEQICSRAYMEGVLASSLLAIGAIGVFAGIEWMLVVYIGDDSELTVTAGMFIFISFLVVVALLTVSGVDVVENSHGYKAPLMDMWPLYAYGPCCLIMVGVVRLLLARSEKKQRATSGVTSPPIGRHAKDAPQGTTTPVNRWPVVRYDGTAGWVWQVSVAFPATYSVIVVITYAILTSLGGWPTADNLADWKTYLALSVAMFFPGVTVITYAWTIPRVGFWVPIVNWLWRLIPKLLTPRRSHQSVSSAELAQPGHQE